MKRKQVWKNWQARARANIKLYLDEVLEKKRQEAEQSATVAKHSSQQQNATNGLNADGKSKNS